MTKKTWKFTTDAAAVVAAAASVTAAAAELQVDRGTIHRWIRAKRVPAPRGRRDRPVPVRETTAAPLGAKPVVSWGQSVREAYVLSATERTLVDLAEAALGMAQDPALKSTERLLAAARFQSLVKQLNLEVAHGEVETVPAWPRRVG